MLVIRRRVGEKLLIGDDVELEILDATPSQVKIGIRAPRSVTILRKEIHLTQEQNRESAREIHLEAIERLHARFNAHDSRIPPGPPIKLL